MKTILILIILTVTATFTTKTEAGLITKTNLVISTPLPEEFDGLTKTNVFGGGIYPAAIYAFTNGMLGFECVGTVFETDTNKFGLIAPEHVFSKKHNWSYAIRIAYPNNSNILGFVNEIIYMSKNGFNNDIALATIGKSPHDINGFSEILETNAVYILETNRLTIRNQPVTSIHSLVTGREFPIIGYGLERNQDKNHPFVVIEIKSHAGYSGTPFYDENKRLFILHGGLMKDSSTFSEIDEYFLSNYHRHVEGVALLVGPIAIF